MHTSYEQRLEFLHQFLEGAEVFHTNITNGALIKGDGWEVSSSWCRGCGGEKVSVWCLSGN